MWCVCAPRGLEEGALCGGCLGVAHSAPPPLRKECGGCVTVLIKRDVLAWGARWLAQGATTSDALDGPSVPRTHFRRRLRSKGSGRRGVGG